MNKIFDINRKYFTYAIESSSFYCMPEEGSKIHLYFGSEKEEGGKRRRYVYHGDQLLVEEREEETSRYILGYGVVGREEEKGTKKEFVYYHLDEQNSTHIISNEREELENVYCYHAYGEIEEKEERIENEIQYVGQQYDKGSGLYYLRARYYQPKIGRFLQEDVYRGDGLNLYAYCKNNPVMYYDPSGYADTPSSPNSCDKSGVNPEPSTKGNGKTGEITYPLERTHESARNTLMKELDNTGAFTNGSNAYYGRLESSYGFNKQIGRQSLDGKVRWRLDYDPNKGVHYNFEDFTNGKGANAKKIAIPIDISYDEYKSIIDWYNH